MKHVFVRISLSTAVMLCISILPNSVHAQGLTLTAAVQKALAGHPEIRSSRAAIQAEKGRKLSAVSPASPEVLWHEEDIDIGKGIGTGGQKVIQISQTFDLPLLTGARGHVYGGAQKAAEMRLGYAMQTITSRVIVAYACLYARRKQLDILTQGLELAKEFERKAEKRIESGENTHIELMRARAARASASIDLEAGRVRVSEAEGQLSQAVGELLPQNVTLADSIAPFRIQGAMTRDIDAIVDNHPEYLAAKARVEGVSDDAAWRWMEYAPSFRAAWFQQNYAGYGRMWGMELGMQVPLWFFLGQRGRSMEADAAAVQAEAELAALRISLSSNARNSIKALEAAQHTFDAYNSDLRNEADETMRTATVSFDTGRIGYLEYLTTRQSVNAIHLGYYDAMIAFFTAAAAWENATGGRVLSAE